MNAHLFDWKALEAISHINFVSLEIRSSIGILNVKRISCIKRRLKSLYLRRLAMNVKISIELLMLSMFEWP